MRFAPGSKNARFDVSHGRDRKLPSRANFARFSTRRIGKFPRLNREWPWLNRARRQETLRGRKRHIMELIAWLFAVFVVICAVVYFCNRQFMYFPDPTRVTPGQAGLDGVQEVKIAG